MNKTKTTPFIGWLRSISGTSLWLDDGESDWIPVVFDGEHETPINTRIALSVYQSDTGEYRVNPVGKYYNILSEGMGYSDTTRKHVLLLRFIPVNATEAVQKAGLERAQSLASQVEAYWRYHAEGRWDVRIVGDVMKTDCYADSPMFCGARMKKYSEGLELPDGFTPNYFHALSDVDGSVNGWCGQAIVGGSYGATFRGCGIRTVIHELGHQFGIMHAASEEADGSISEYGDISCIMGSYHNLPGLNSPHLLFFGFEEPNEVKTISSSEQVLICPIELPPNILHENEYQHILIRKENITYYVSTRKQQTPYKVDKAMRDNYVYVHSTSVNHGKDAAYTILRAKLRQGQSFFRDNFKIDYIGYDNETARVNIEFDGKPVTNNLPINYGFPEHIVSQEIDERHYGIWADELFDGQGIEVHVRNGRLFVIWYTMSMSTSGGRRFYYGTCDLGEGPENFELYTTTGGSFEQPESAKVVKAGEAQIFFYNENSGVFNFNTEEYGKGSLTLNKPVAKSSNPLNGLWIQDGARPNEGFTIQIFDHLDFATCFWYTYGSKSRSGGQRWFMCSGPSSGKTTYDLTIYEVLDNKGLQVTTPNIVPVGNATLNTFGDKMKFTYNINSPASVITQDEYELIRLF